MKSTNPINHTFNITMTVLNLKLRGWLLVWGFHWPFPCASSCRAEAPVFHASCKLLFCVSSQNLLFFVVVFSRHLFLNVILKRDWISLHQWISACDTNLCCVFSITKKDVATNMRSLLQCNMASVLPKNVLTAHSPLVLLRTPN